MFRRSDESIGNSCPSTMKRSQFKLIIYSFFRGSAIAYQHYCRQLRTKRQSLSKTSSRQFRKSKTSVRVDGQDHEILLIKIFACAGFPDYTTQLVHYIINYRQKKTQSRTPFIERRSRSDSIGGKRETGFRWRERWDFNDSVSSCFYIHLIFIVRWNRSG